MYQHNPTQYVCSQTFYWVDNNNVDKSGSYNPLTDKLAIMNQGTTTLYSKRFMYYIHGNTHVP